MLEYFRYFALGDKIQIEVPNREQQYTSQIVDMYKDGTLDILAPIYKNRVVYLVDNMTVNIILPKGEAIYQIRARVLKKINDKISIVRLEIVSDIIKIQRRDYFRLRVVKSIKVRKVEDIKENKFGDTIKASMLDISGGGMQFSASKELDEGDMLEISFDLTAAKEMTLFGIVRRKIYTNNPKAAFNYGVKFEKISEFERNEITKFIFEEQRKLIKKGLM